MLPARRPPRHLLLAFVLLADLTLWRASGARAETTGAAAPAAGSLYELKAARLSYLLVHRLHEVRGTSEVAEGRAKVAADGSARVQVRARVASFDSGNANRDAHMREVTHAAAHPDVEVRCRLDPGPWPPTASTTRAFAGTVAMNGVQAPMTGEATILPDQGRFRVIVRFPVSLGALQIERPELLLVKVDDAITIEGELTFAPEGTGVTGSAAEKR